MESTRVPPGDSIVGFGTYVVDLRAGEVRKSGVKIKLQDQPFRVLAVLLEHAGQVVTREELKRVIWPAESFGDFDHAVNVAVTKLRAALGDSTETPQFVETLPRRGYRFIATIQRASEAQARVSLPPPHWFGKRRVLGTGILFVFALVLLVVNARLRSKVFGRGESSSPTKIMLAVLPFENLSSDPRQEYFAVGMTEEMISQLGRIEPERLGVIARGSVVIYGPGNQSTDRVAQELGVQYILVGSVRSDDRRVRITTALVQTADRTELWTKEYDAEINDVLSLQSRVARDVAGIIQVKLSPGARAGRAHDSVDPEAFQLYLRGRYDLNRIWDKGGNERLATAIHLFQQSVEKDRAYAPAYAGLAEAYMWGVNKGLDPAHTRETEASALAAAEEALRIDSSLADAHIAMALYLESQWDFAAMNEEAKRATELDPNYARAHESYGVLLIHLGRLEDASTQMRLAATLDPRSLRFLNFMGHYYDAARQWDKVIEISEAEIKLDPDFLFPYAFLVGAYEEKGMFVEALQAYLRGAERAGEDMREANKVARKLRAAYDAGGAHGYWKKNLQLTLEDVRRGEPPDYVGIASTCVHAADIDQAFSWLEHGYQSHSIGMVTIKQLEGLRADPRYQDLVRRIGLPP